jgi:hypothetical protein
MTMEPWNTQPQLVLVWDSSTVGMHSPTRALRAELRNRTTPFPTCAHIARLEHCKGLALSGYCESALLPVETHPSVTLFRHYIEKKGRHMLVWGRIDDSIFF